MRKQLACGIILGLLLAGSLSLQGKAAAAEANGQMIVHDVYFSLKDNSADARAKLVKACKKYLTKHPGEVFFAAGILAPDLKRPVNDRNFDVGLHIVFKNQKAHDDYQESERHKEFIKENKDNWKKVRVFDTVVEKK